MLADAMGRLICSHLQHGGIYALSSPQKLFGVSDQYLNTQAPTGVSCCHTNIIQQPRLSAGHKYGEQASPIYVILGAGVVGLTTILEIRRQHPSSNVVFSSEISQETPPLHTHQPGLAGTRFIMQLAMGLRRSMIDGIQVSCYSRKLVPISRCKWEIIALQNSLVTEEYSHSSTLMLSFGCSCPGLKHLKSCPCLYALPDLLMYDLI